MRVLATGICGAGKFTAMGELAARGWHATDLDTPDLSEWTTDAAGQPDWTWRTERLSALLDDVGASPLFSALIAPGPRGAPQRP